MTRSDAERLQGLGEYHIFVDRGAPLKERVIDDQMSMPPSREEVDDERSSNKRRRVVSLASEERDSSTATPLSNRAQSTTAEHTREGNSTDEDGNNESDTVEDRPARYRSDALEYQEEPYMGQASLLQRAQQENDNQYGFLRGKKIRIS